MSKLHFGDTPKGESGLFLTACGRLEPEVTKTPEQVSCLHCRKRLGLMGHAAKYVEEAFSVRLVTEYAAREYPDPIPLFDVGSGLPVVSRETWTVLRQGRHHHCTSCSVCRHFTEIDAHAAAKPWQKVHRVRQELEYRFSSVSHALEWYADILEDGYPSSTIGDILENLYRLGTMIHTSDGVEQKAIAAAQDKLVIDKALGTLYRGASRRGLSRAQRLRILFATTVGKRTPRGRVPKKPHIVASELGHNLTGPMVTAIATEGRRKLKEALSLVSMVPGH